MQQGFEYTVIPAPSRGEKARGARTGIERFSVALTIEINRMAEDGWEYIRAEVLPCEERTGLTGRQTVYHNVLVFRRSLHPVPSHQAVAAPVAMSQDASVLHTTPMPTPAAAPLMASRTTTLAAAPVSASPATSPQPVARMEPPLSAAGRAEPPADWPDAQPPLRGDDPDLADERDIASQAEGTGAEPPARKGIFSSIMPGGDAPARSTRLGPAER